MKMETSGKYGTLLKRVVSFCLWVLIAIAVWQKAFVDSNYFIVDEADKYKGHVSEFCWQQFREVDASGFVTPPNYDQPWYQDVCPENTSCEGELMSYEK